jgi:hypothetical protein
MSRRTAAVTARTWPEIQTRELVRIIVPAIALVDVDAPGRHSGQQFQIGDDRPSVCPPDGSLTSTAGSWTIERP